MRQTNGMDSMDYYALLGVERSSPPEEITRAYRLLARQHHPDLHPEDAKADMRFKKVNQAYHVLSDPEQRMQYDQQLAGSQPPPEPAPATGYAHSAQDEQATAEQETACMRREDTENIEGVVSDLAAALQEIAGEASDELRAALRNFGSDLDAISRSLAGTAGAAGNRARRRAFRPPPPVQKPPPRGGRPPWDGRPPYDGRPPKP